MKTTMKTTMKLSELGLTKIGDELTVMLPNGSLMTMYICDSGLWVDERDSETEDSNQGMNFSNLFKPKGANFYGDKS